MSELDLLREPTTNPEAPYYAQNLANYLTEAAKPKQVPMQAPVFPGETNPITGLPKTEQLPVSPNQPVTQPSPLMQQAKEFLAGVWDVAKSVPGAVGGGVVGGVVGGPIGSALGAGLGVQLEESYDAWKAGDLPRLADLATGGLFTSTIQHGGNAVDALTHLKPTTAMAEIAKSVPFFGPMAAQVEQYLKEGKYSRAAGLTAGLAIVPKVGEKVHGAVISKAANFVANEVDRMTTEANAKAVEISKNPDEVAKQAQLVVLKDQLDKDTKAVLDSGAIDAVVEDDLSVRAHEVEQIKQTQAQPKPITKEELVQIAKDYLAEKKAKAPAQPEPPVPGTLAQPTPEKPLEGPTPYTGPERRGPQQPTLYIGPRRRTTDQIIQEAMEAEQKKPVEVTTEPTPPVPSKIEQTGEPSITAEEIARLDKINPDWDLLSNEELSKLLGRELGPEPTKAEPITEVDLQTGTPEPPALATQDSPFREKDATATKSRTEIYGKSKSVANNLDELFNQDPTMPTKNPATTLYKLTNDINRYLDGEPGVDVEGTRNFLSELAANVDDFRNQFGDAQSFNQFKTLVSETAKWARNGDRSKISQTIPTTSLYSGLDPFEAARRVRDLFKGKVTPGEEIPSASSDIIKAGREIANYTKMARDIKSFNLKDIIGKTRQELALALLERSGTIRRQMLDQLGERGYDIVQRMYLARGATARATNMLRQMRNEVYSGLSSNERKILDDLILDVRMIDISGYKTEKQFRPPKPIINFKIHKQLFAYKEVVGIV